MKYLSIAITLLAILNSCTQEYLFSPTDSTVSIVGNLSVPFQDNTARGIRSNYLPDGSCISFYSSGGISADNLLLTYERKDGISLLNYNGIQNDPKLLSPPITHI